MLQIINLHGCEYILNQCPSEFQSDILTLQTSTPDLTDCFQNTVLVWIPCGFFWISMIYWIPFLQQQERRSHWGQSSVLNLVKSVRANIFPLNPEIDDANLKGTFEFSLNVFTEFIEFSAKSICHYSKRA